MEAERRCRGGLEGSVWWSRASKTTSWAGFKCPFCVLSLGETIESPECQAMASSKGTLSIHLPGPATQGTHSVVLLDGFLEPPSGLTLLCCARVGLAPLSKQSQNRRMDWSSVCQSGTPMVVCVLQSYRHYSDLSQHSECPCWTRGSATSLVLDGIANQRWSWCP